MNTRQPVSVNRRSFFWKLGAGASAALASTAGLAKPEAAPADDAALRAALLEEEKALRQLHKAYERAMDQGHFADAVALFASDAEVLFNGRVFDQREQGISRLYNQVLRSGKTGRHMEQAPGFELAAGQLHDKVEVAEDRRTATAQIPYSIQVGMPVESENSLADMARLHDEGVRTWWEGGAYHLSYVKDAADGRWKIRRLEYRTLSRADWRSGRTHATAMPESPLSARHLDDAMRNGRQA